jgi:hypothetical protein
MTQSCAEVAPLAEDAIKKNTPKEHRYWGDDSESDTQSFDSFFLRHDFTE